MAPAASVSSDPRQIGQPPHKASCASVSRIVKARMSLRSLVKNNVPLICLYYVFDDWKVGRQLQRGRIETDSGRRHKDARLDTSLDYIDRIFADYLRYAGIDSFYGRVCEIGPGDNFGLAVRALDSGADEVIAIDRFYSKRDPEFQNRLYRAMAERHGLHRFFDGEPSEETLSGVQYRPSEAAETFFADKIEEFDFIVSRAVFEHLYDPLGALDDMIGALRPGGTLIHRVDLRDHGMFFNLNPLTFLTVPGQIYRRMVSNSGRPNRVMFADYRDWLERSGLTGSLRITRLAGVDGEFEPSDWG
ncbi:MAG: methyltransferase domain-containing protein, partial [Phycisphaerales bacterium]|nr:methyltransferase domain-containing protein [Phycisphaerales bacterium]